MPWEVTIRRPDGSPLGDIESVRRQMTSAVPGIQFHQEPSGSERIAAARKAGVELPEVIRQHMENQPATARAEYDSGEFSVSFYGFERIPLSSVLAEVRGNGDPVSILAALCLPNGWIIIDAASGEPVDLSGNSPTGWDSFREYRDQAIRTVEEAEDK